MWVEVFLKMHIVVIFYVLYSISPNLSTKSTSLKSEFKDFINEFIHVKKNPMQWRNTKTTNVSSCSFINGRLFSLYILFSYNTKRQNVLIFHASLYCVLLKKNLIPLDYQECIVCNFNLSISMFCNINNSSAVKKQVA